jgi:hypothetical protein
MFLSSMRQLMIVIVASFLMTSNVQAVHKSLSGVKTVKIELQDQAKGACWTNLKEVREYAEEKFRIEGIKVVEDYPKSNGKVVFEKGMYWLTIRVASSRIYSDASGPCSGFISLSLNTVTWIDDVYHVGDLHRSTSGGRNKTNLNNYTIQAVQRLFDDFH